MDRKLQTPVFAAFILWFAMFSPWTKTDVNFWGLMLSAACLLTLASSWYGRDMWQNRVQQWAAQPFRQALSYWSGQFLLGLLVAAVLGGICYVCNMLIPFSTLQTDVFAGAKWDGDPRLLLLALVLIIGPAQELFWRAYVQESFVLIFRDSSSSLVARNAPVVAFCVTTLIYTAIFVPSMNPLLIVGALAFGCVWGLLYLWRSDWLPAIILSHGLLDAAFFCYVSVL